MTVTCGSDMTFCSAAVICSCNWIGVRPAALISPTKGSVIMPSGRTGTVLESSPSFHTLIARTSSTPDDVGVGTNVGYLRVRNVRGRKRASPWLRLFRRLVGRCRYEAGSTGLASARNGIVSAVLRICRGQRPTSSTMKTVSLKTARFPLSVLANTSLHLGMGYSALSASFLVVELARRCGMPTSLSL